VEKGGSYDYNYHTHVNMIIGLIIGISIIHTIIQNERVNGQMGVYTGGKEKKSRRKTYKGYEY
jgi:hypothetical protein